MSIFTSQFNLGIYLAHDYYPVDSKECTLASTIECSYGNSVARFKFAENTPGIIGVIGDCINATIKDLSGLRCDEYNLRSKCHAYAATFSHADCTTKPLLFKAQAGISNEHYYAISLCCDRDGYAHLSIMKIYTSKV